MSWKTAEDPGWVFYKDRPEWKDVVPVPQDDGPYPVVQILYSPKFRDIFDYFRAVFAKKEISERALQLTQDASQANPGNYTLWNYRRFLLKELKKDLREELKFVHHIIEDTPKNYQTWFHRKVIVEWLNDPGMEKIATEKILSLDEKNYHAWEHRQWVIKNFDLWDGELEYIDELLKEDIRNNSAWNHRYFIISHTTKLDEDTLVSEIDYTLDKISKVTNNESSWNYLRGILQDEGLTKFPQVPEFTQQLYDSGCRSPHLLAFMIDITEEQLLNGGDSSQYQKAFELCDALAKKHDIIRKEYWNFIARNLGNLFGPKEAHARQNVENVLCKLI